MNDEDLNQPMPGDFEPVIHGSATGSASDVDVLVMQILKKYGPLHPGDLTTKIYECEYLSDGFLDRFTYVLQTLAEMNRNGLVIFPRDDSGELPVRLPNQMEPSMGLSA